MSTVDPLQAALGGSEPEPSGDGDSGNPNGAASIDHPVLGRFGGDVNKALDAYQQLDSEYGRQGDRLGKQVAELQSQLAQLQAQREPEQQGYEQQGGLPDVGLDQLQQWYEEDPAQATAFLIAQGAQMQEQRITELLDKRLGPVEKSVGQTTASALVENLGKALGGDVVQRNAQVLIDLRETDPAFFQGDPQLVFGRMKTAVLAAEMERGSAGRGASQGGAAAANVAVEGGSGGRNPQSVPEQELDPAQAFLAEMLDTNVKRDIFGNEIRTS